MALVELIIGPMFSGKSTELIRRCSTYKAIDKNVVVINHTLDTRCGMEVKTHSSAKFPAFKTTSLCDLFFETIPDVIAIDEAQFFDDIDVFIKNMERFPIVIIVAGLDSDYKRNPFGKIPFIIPLANTVTKLSSMCCVCKDGTKAAFTKRLVHDADAAVVCIGSNVIYQAVCRKHYF